MLKSVSFLLLFFVLNLVNGQNEIHDATLYKADYLLTYLQDTTNQNSKSEEVMSLIIGKSYSLFQSENTRFNDSLIVNLSTNAKYDPQMAVNIAMASKKSTIFNFKIYKQKQELLVFDKIFSDKFIYKEPIKLKWEIIENTMQINGYLCQKATTTFAGRNYVAWFSNTIPINDGPYKFKGLPGLIIKIYDTKKQYVFELLSLKTYKSNFSLDLKSAQNVTKTEYFKAYNDFKNDIIGQLEQRGITFDNSNAEQVKQSIKKSRANEIELINN